MGVRLTGLKPLTAALNPKAALRRVAALNPKAALRRVAARKPKAARES
jgi:hypothetical protein